MKATSLFAPEKTNNPPNSNRTARTAIPFTDIGIASRNHVQAMLDCCLQKD